MQAPDISAMWQLSGYPMLSPQLVLGWVTVSEFDSWRRHFILYVTSHQGRLSLLPSVGGKMSTSQMAVMFCGWEVKAGMACLQVKLCVAIYERFGKCNWYLEALYKCPGLLYFYFTYIHTRALFTKSTVTARLRALEISAPFSWQGQFACVMVRFFVFLYISTSNLTNNNKWKYTNVMTLTQANWQWFKTRISCHWQTCVTHCKQIRWTFSVINLQPNYVDNA